MAMIYTRWAGPKITWLLQTWSPVPCEFIVIALSAGNARYLVWLEASCGGRTGSAPPP